jgi:hypothetical protein
VTDCTWNFATPTKDNGDEQLVLSIVRRARARSFEMYPQLRSIASHGSALLTRCRVPLLRQTGISLAALAAAGLCGITVAALRPRIDYSPLLRDLPQEEASLLGRSGYGTISSSGADARLGDIEVQTFSQGGGAAWKAQ